MLSICTSTRHGEHPVPHAEPACPVCEIIDGFSADLHEMRAMRDRLSGFLLAAWEVLHPIPATSAMARLQQAVSEQPIPEPTNAPEPAPAPTTPSEPVQPEVDVGAMKDRCAELEKRLSSSRIDTIRAGLGLAGLAPGMDVLKWHGRGPGAKRYCEALENAVGELQVVEPPASVVNCAGPFMPAPGRSDLYGELVCETHGAGCRAPEVQDSKPIPIEPVVALATTEPAISDLQRADELRAMELDTLRSALYAATGWLAPITTPQEEMVAEVIAAERAKAQSNDEPF